MTQYVKTYPCPTCGAAASGRGHLCHPRSDSPFTCEFCEKPVSDPRHVCTSMLDDLQYICRKCGRLAVYDSQLCEPEPIDAD